ncbi:MAG: hypothetical protein AB1847_11455 [bacterium]
MEEEPLPSSKKEQQIMQIRLKSGRALDIDQFFCGFFCIAGNKEQGFALLILFPADSNWPRIEAVMYLGFAGESYDIFQHVKKKGLDCDIYIPCPAAGQLNSG